jgi:hypothetical protein
MTITLLIILTVLSVIVGIFVQRKNNVVEMTQNGEKKLAEAVVRQVSLGKVKIENEAQKLANKL